MLDPRALQDLESLSGSTLYLPMVTSIFLGGEREERIVCVNHEVRRKDNERAKQTGAVLSSGARNICIGFALTLE